MQEAIGWEEIDSAVDRVIVGLEKRGAEVSMRCMH